jgi:hypothetical protein
VLLSIEEMPWAPRLSTATRRALRACAQVIGDYPALMLSELHDHHVAEDDLVLAPVHQLLRGFPLSVAECSPARLPENTQSASESPLT